MSVTVVLPAQLGDLTGGLRSVELDGRPATLRDVFVALHERLPAAHDRILDERGEVIVLPAVSGG